MPSPKEIYQRKLSANQISEDSEQARIVDLFQELYEQILASNDSKSGFGRFLSGWIKKSDATNSGIQGLYLWGGVGRGKTFLMDIFYESLPIEEKQRTHFHRFMQSVHKQLTDLQGEKNPLQIVAQDIAAKAKVLCFDEFFVIDIGDAMILAGLLEELFKLDVILVTTSNIYPDGLYENGLQRERFLPAIELIKANTLSIEIKSEVDYRLRSLSQAQLYLCPNNAFAYEKLAAQFKRLTQEGEMAESEVELIVLDRAINAITVAGDVAWFDFKELCAGARSAFDYVEIAKLFHTVIISDIKQMSHDEDDIARRFVSLIDELYDRRVKLVVSAEVPIEAIYSGKSLAFAFERTTSRLLEMQSHEYLCTAHNN